MTKVYKCNYPEDYHRLLDMYPGSCWADGDEDCEKDDLNHCSHPIAVYVNNDETPTLMDYSSIESATYYMLQSPNEYVFVEFPELLNPIDVLRTFLKHHKVYEDFNQLSQKSVMCNPIRGTVAYKAIEQCGFTWQHTPYYSSFWRKLDEKWRLLCDHFGISNQVIGKYHEELFSKD